jgi:hypothetical protein
MKKLWCVVILCVGVSRANAQEFEIAQLILNIEKLVQLKNILQDMKDGYEILTTGYNAVKDLAEGNFSLHKVFLDGLLEVSPTVRHYKRIAQIVEMQLELVRTYKTAVKRFRLSELFSPMEMDYLEGVYARLYNSSMRNLEDLTMVITAGTMRMSDDERLTEIDRIYADMSDKLVFLRSFNEENSVLLFQKVNANKDVRVLRELLK